MKKQKGAALMVILVILGVIGAYFALKALNSGQAQREQETADTLAQGREALIGFAANYRATHATEALGYLPCPDINNDGNAEANCAASDYGRLPWRTLQTSALRDSNGVCLWYAISGAAKDAPKTTPFNWDSIGQFIVRDAALPPNTLAGATLHDRPLAVIIAPHKAINGQVRPIAAGTVECDGGVADTPNQYLDNLTTPNTIVLATSDSFRNESNNDRGVWITSKSLFDRVKQSPNFKNDIDTLIGDLTNHLNNLPTAALPAAGGNKGIDTVIDTPVTGFLARNPATYAAGTLKRNVLDNWRDNLLYTGPITASVNGTGGCAAVLLFGGERQSVQSRATAAEKLAVTNYLEAPNVTFFPGNGAYTGNKYFTAASASTDVVRCVTGLPAGATQKSFANDFSSFNAIGPGVTPNPDQSVTFANGGASGACFWFNSAIPLAGKTLRAYYDYQFSWADTYALSGGTDRGNGFSLQMTRNDLGGAPTGCGAESNMGVLTAGAPFGHDPNGTNSLFGQRSFIFETDVHRDGGHTDPAENHTAIMLNGTLNHALSGTMSTSCDGSASGCRHSPANKFEENPPLPHNQRIEIVTGCNAACTVCNPASHVAPNTSARISIWVDCKNCSDVTANFGELIAAQANRDFSAAGDWSGTNWSIGAGVFSHLAGATSASLPNTALHSPPTAGASYRLAVKTTTASAGTLTISFGGASNVLNLPAGTVTQNLQLKAVSAAPLTLTPNATWAGSIDDFSITPLPTIQRCTALQPEMNTFYFGFTGGFRAGAAQQGVTLQNFILRTE